MKKILLTLIFIMLIIMILNSKFLMKKIYKTEFGEYVEKYSQENNVDPLMIYALIKTESNFDEGATSNKGACGLMQIMDNTAREIAQNTLMEYESGITLYNPENNIKIGIKYFAELRKTFGNDEIALAAYNAGSGNVNKWIEEGIINADGSNIENIPYKETNLYVRKTLRNYKIYKYLYNS